MGVEGNEGDVPVEINGGLAVDVGVLVCEGIL